VGGMAFLRMPVRIFIYICRWRASALEFHGGIGCGVRKGRAAHYFRTWSRQIRGGTRPFPPISTQSRKSAAVLPVGAQADLLLFDPGHGGIRGQAERVADSAGGGPAHDRFPTGRCRRCSATAQNPAMARIMAKARQGPRAHVLGPAFQPNRQGPHSAIAGQMTDCKNLVASISALSFLPEGSHAPAGEARTKRSSTSRRAASASVFGARNDQHGQLPLPAGRACGSLRRGGLGMPGRERRLHAGCAPTAFEVDEIRAGAAYLIFLRHPDGWPGAPVRLRTLADDLAARNRQVAVRAVPAASSVGYSNPPRLLIFAADSFRPSSSHRPPGALGCRQFVPACAGTFLGGGSIILTVTYGV